MKRKGIWKRGVVVSGIMLAMNLSGCSFFVKKDSGNTDIQSVRQESENADNDIQIGNPFSCFIIRVRLSWNIQFFTKLSLCKMMIFSKPLKIGCQLNIRHEDTSIYKKSEICLNIFFIIPIFPVNGFICNLTKNIS